MSIAERFKKPTDPEQIRRTPPGQHLTAGFPVLSYGSTPTIDLATWRFQVGGLVEGERVWTWEEFNRLPQTEMTVDIHCVTTWSRLDSTFSGVLFRDLAAELSIRPEARYVIQHCYGGYSTNLPLNAMTDGDVMLAHSFNGVPLEPDHGWPLRLIVPKLYFWKSAKWLNRLEFTAEDRLGFWERNGYHNQADPWKEQRYAPPEQYR